MPRRPPLTESIVRAILAQPADKPTAEIARELGLPVFLVGRHRRLESAIALRIAQGEPAPSVPPESLQTFLSKVKE